MGMASDFFTSSASVNIFQFIFSVHKNLQIKIFFLNLFFLVLLNFSYWCVLNQDLENDPNSFFGHTRETQKRSFFAEIVEKISQMYIKLSLCHVKVLGVEKPSEDFKDE